jgi:cysteine desulfurase/selenocysteine lyase
LEAGITNIEQHVIGLNRYAAEGIRKKGYTIVTDLHPDRMSGILSFWGTRTPELYAQLTQKGIIVSLRHGWIRIAPHLYNNEEDIDKLLAAL